jgi:hypothetical protein
MNYLSSGTTELRTEPRQSGFWELPPAVVLVLLWLTGVLLLGLGAVSLYQLWLLLQVALGA